MSSISVDVSQVRELAVRLNRAPAGAAAKVRAATRKGAVNIKAQLRQEMRRSLHFKQIEPYITFDVTEGANFIEAEIGPRAEGAGLLENIAYFGTSRGGGTVPDPESALDDERPAYVDHLEQAATDIL